MNANEEANSVCLLTRVFHLKETVPCFFLKYYLLASISQVVQNCLPNLAVEFDTSKKPVVRPCMKDFVFVIVYDQKVWYIIVAEAHVSGGCG